MKVDNFILGWWAIKQNTDQPNVGLIELVGIDKPNNTKISIIAHLVGYQHFIKSSNIRKNVPRNLNVY
jgi:hypothetical protein